MSEVGRLYLTLDAKTKEFQSKMNDVQSKMQDVGKKIGSAGSTMTKNVTVPLLAIGGAIGGAMIKFGDFADQMLDMSAITGMSTDDLQKWRSVAVDAGVDVDAAGDAMQRFNKRLERGSDVAPAMRDAIEGMNMSVDEFKDLNADEKMRLMVQQMMDMDDAGRVAFANKMNIPELLPMVEELKAQGMDVDQILAEMEVPFSEADLKTMNEFRQSWDNLKESVFLLIGQALQPAFEWFSNNREVIENQLQGALESLSDTISKLVEWWQNLSPGMQDFIKQAGLVLIVVGPILIIVGKIIAVFSVLIPIIKVVAAVFAILTGPIGLVVAAIAAVIAIGVLLYKNWDEVKAWAIEIWGKIVEFFQGIWETITGIFSGGTEGTGNVVAEWLSGIWNSIVEVFKKLIEFYIGIWDSILGVFGTSTEEVLGVVTDWLDGVWKTITEIWGKVTGFFEGIWKAIKALFSGETEEAAGIVTGWLSGIWDSITEIWNNIIEFLGGIWDSILGVFGTSTDQVFGVVEEWLNSAQAFIEEVWEAISGFFGSIWEAIKALFRGDIDEIGGHLENAFGGMATFLETLWNSIKDFMFGIWDNIKSGVTERASSLTEAIITTVNKALEWIKALPQQALQWGKDIIQGLINGISNMAGAVGDAIKGVAQGAINSVKSAFGMSSPSKVMLAIGNNVSGSLGKGISDNASAATGALAALGSNLKSQAAGIAKDVSGELSKIKTPDISKPDSKPDPEPKRHPDEYPEDEWIPPQSDYPYKPEGMWKRLTIDQMKEIFGRSPYGVWYKPDTRTYQDALNENPDLPYYHNGGVYRAPTPGGEGLAMLKDGETVLPTHKPGWNIGGEQKDGGRRTLHHLLEFRNLPDDMNEDRLAKSIARILKRPDVMEELDVANYKNMKLALGRSS